MDFIIVEDQRLGNKLNQNQYLMIHILHYSHHVNQINMMN